MNMKPTPRPPSPRRAPRRMVRPLHARAAAKEDDFDDYDSAAEPSMKLSHAFIVVLVLHVLAVGGVYAFNTLKTHRSPAAPKAAASEKAVQPSAPKAETAVPTAATTASAKSEPAAKPAAAPSKSDGSATHTVVAGDTLTRIATLHKTTVEAIEKANGLEPAATIRVGQMLQIPAAAAAKSAAPAVAKSSPSAPVKADPVKASPTKPAAPAASPSTVAKAAPSAPPAAPAKTSGASYTVAKGDNPYSIAKKFKVSYSELIKANKIEDPTKLQIGQVLIIP